MGALDRLDAALATLDEAGTAELDKVLAEELAKPWLPTPGPQLEAFLSEADLLLYGGAAGGGKTDLLCGLALTEHKRSVIFRRQANDLDGFWERLLQLYPQPRHKDSNKKKLSTHDSRMVECGHLELPGSELSWQGRPHDLIGFDEGAQLSADKVMFVLGWLRSADGIRCRAVIASNPPMGNEGAWLLEWFAPWLDPLFPKPAAPGELRWAAAVGTAAEIRTIWVDGPEPVVVEGDGWRIANETELSDPDKYKVLEPLSRTFIPSKLDDNPYLKDTKYRAQINAQPEPRRSQLLLGDFLAGREDDEWQVVPSLWVRAAQARWTGDPATRMKAIATDPAQGGPDKTAIARLHEGNHFARIESRPGIETPDGPAVAALILKLRRDSAAIAIDMTGGWGGSARDHLKTNNEIAAVPIVFSSAGEGTDKDTQLEYANLRAKMYWEFRTALDPDNGENIILPPGDRLMAQLTAGTWRERSGKIQIESKEAIKARLGSSPDEADAIVMAWYIRDRAVREKAKLPLPKGLPRPSQGSQSWMG